MISNIFEMANKLFLAIIILATITFAYRFKYIALGFKKDKILPKAKIQNKFCILIPARNESNVIDRLLKSLKNQRYDSNKYDVYVIVESNEDPTVEIVKNYGYNVFLRKNLNNVGKGYAMNECIQEILEKEIHYDILTIIDADNILDPNMLAEFNNAYCYGYLVGNAYRRQINKPGNWLADCSTLTFAGINTFQNKARSQMGRNVIFSGSGLYIDFNIIKNANGWPFTTLTEDYELSMWCTIHNIPTVFLHTTYYYDEQPTTFLQSRKQRVRWIKGFFQCRKKYSKELKKSMLKSNHNISSKLDISIGVVPNILYIVGIILYELFNFVMLIYLCIIKNSFYLIALKNFLLVLLITYLILQMYTLLQLRAEKQHLKYDFKSSIKILLLNPLYICLYIPFAVEALVSKKVGWAPIKHGQTQTITTETTENTENIQGKVSVND